MTRQTFVCFVLFRFAFCSSQFDCMIILMYRVDGVLALVLLWQFI